MIPLLALALFAPGSDPAGHAGLHPAGTDLYLELPDAGALLEACDQAPLTRLLADPQAREAFAAFGIGAPDPVGAIDRLAEGLFGVDGAAELLRGTGAISLSVQLGPEGSLRWRWLADLPGQEAAGHLAGVLARSGAEILPGGSARWSHEGARLVGEGGAPAAEGATGNLSQAEGFRAARAALGPATGEPLLVAYVRRSPLELAAHFVQGFDLASVFTEVPAAVDFLGAERLLRTSLSGGRFVTESFERSSGGGPLGGSAVESAWLGRIPSDVMFFYSSALEGAALKSRLSGTGMEELAAGVGPGFVVYTRPLAGLALPETFAWVELADPAAVLERLPAIAEALAGRYEGASSRTRDYRVRDAEGERHPVPITAVTLPEGTGELYGPMPAVKPSFCVVDGWLLASTSEMHLKRELKRIFGGEGEALALEATALRLDAETRSVIFFDWNRLVGGVLSLARTLGGMLGSMGDAGMPDLSKLPGPELFERHLGPTLHTSHAVEGGRLRRHVSSFGPETWLAPLAGALVGWGQLGEALTGPAPAASAPAEPATPR